MVLWRRRVLLLRDQFFQLLAIAKRQRDRDTELPVRRHFARGELCGFLRVVAWNCNLRFGWENRGNSNRDHQDGSSQSSDALQTDSGE
jgi:hypothetical protein